MTATLAVPGVSFDSIDFLILTQTNRNRKGELSRYRRYHVCAATAG